MISKLSQSTMEIKSSFCSYNWKERSVLTRARIRGLASILNPDRCVEEKTMEIFGHCRPFLITHQHAAFSYIKTKDDGHTHKTYETEAYVEKHYRLRRSNTCQHPCSSILLTHFCMPRAAAQSLCKEHFEVSQCILSDVSLF